MSSSCRRLIHCFIWAICILQFSEIGKAQEICNNGLDDDNNGLIDLNDTIACSCNLQASQVLSLFPNPSFEENIVCPFSFSQMQVLLGNWTNGTFGTADYVNTCGYLLNAETAGLVPFPDGEGAVGGFYANLYKEYVAACLNSPLLANTTYTLRFSVASTLVSSVPNQTCNDLTAGLLSPVNVTLFGAPNCTSLPSPTSLCPSLGDPAWQEIGYVTYTPTQSWTQVEMTFTPTINISAVMLGAPCTLPSDFPDSSSTECLPYFYYDNLVLNDSISFESEPGLISGNTCLTEPILSAVFAEPALDNGNYQWYLNGIAIIGATNSTYIVPSGAEGLGQYQASITNGNICGISEIFNLDTLPPSASFTGLTDSVYLKDQNIALISTSLNANEQTWLWCNDTISSQQAISILLSDTGYCCIKLLVSNNECQDSTEKCIQIIPLDTPEIPNVFTPNKDNINDVFRIKANGAKDLSCFIYNRWGKLVYKWENDVNGFWNGNIGNNEATSGTYFYIVNYTNLLNQTKFEKGSITLLRD